MNTLIEQISIYSENGDGQYPNNIVAKLNGKHSDCPITFYSGGMPLFSLGSDEISEFCEEISKLVP